MSVTFETVQNEFARSHPILLHLRNTSIVLCDLQHRQTSFINLWDAARGIPRYIKRITRGSE
ncbi:PREDICTED: uncharacterized protein LOC108559939 isoform X2 [Nicrophorus vespilloides]|uniref:Uncharacterized protein LOC108559939 isoform X2 n=1 Tax=Nicrophorus vespilloides TaxID=110193 RepID=A0ABM1ME27_NICVS|nr:PREDICTED: uncharacterized protein LOC108559939 isoform X2 [Nicrophorus vespilloides]